MATKLKVAKITSVDLVPEGSCGDAHITLYKNKEGGSTMTFEELKRSLTPEELICLEAAIAKAKTVPGIPGAPGAPGIPGGAGAAMTPEEKKKLEDEKAAAEVAKEEAVKKAATLQAELDTLKKSNTVAGQSDEDILKSANLDPAVKAILERTIAKSKAAEVEIIKAKEAQEAVEFLAKAKEVSFVPEAETKVVELFKSIKGVPGAVDTVMTILKSVNTVIAKGATFKEFGTANQGAASNTSADDAWNAIESAASGLVAKGQVTKAKSIEMVINSQPGLYKTYVEALRNE